MQFVIEALYPIRITAGLDPSGYSISCWAVYFSDLPLTCSARALRHMVLSAGVPFYPAV